jgi:hypothetical protein
MSVPPASAGGFSAKTKLPFAQGDCRKAQTASLGSMMQANPVAGNYARLVLRSVASNHPMSAQ